MIGWGHEPSGELLRGDGVRGVEQVRGMPCEVRAGVEAREGHGYPCRDSASGQGRCGTTAQGEQGGPHPAVEGGPMSTALGGAMSARAGGVMHLDRDPHGTRRQQRAEALTISHSLHLSVLGSVGVGRELGVEGVEGG